MQSARATLWVLDQATYFHCRGRPEPDSQTNATRHRRLAGSGRAWANDKWRVSRLPCALLGEPGLSGVQEQMAKEDVQGEGERGRTATQAGWVGGSGWTAAADAAAAAAAARPGKGTPGLRRVSVTNSRTSRLSSFNESPAVCFEKG